jgi:ORF6N domain
MHSEAEDPEDDGGELSSARDSNLRSQVGTSRGRRYRRTVTAPLAAPMRVDRKILLLLGERVLLDADLAELYGVETKALVRAVKRNASRFPSDFMFQLTADEVTNLRYQTGTSSSAHGGRRYAPYAFTEQGVAMLSSVLHSPRAIAVNIEIMRTFVRLRELLSTHTDLARKLATLEKKYDSQFRMVFDAIRELMTPPAKPKRRIGF